MILAVTMASKSASAAAIPASDDARSWTMTRPQSDFFWLDCKFPAFVGGYGSGKTQALIARAFRDKFLVPGSTVAIYEPTYDLIDLILVPRIEGILAEAGVKYDFNKSKYTINLGRWGKFILRSLSKPERIIGYESFRSHIDEIDTLAYRHAKEVWEKIFARNRQKAGFPNQMCAYTTPEGFNFVYEHWEKNPTPQHRYIVAPTWTNRANLPVDYIESMMAQYDPNRVRAYVDGEFVNMQSGSVYHMYDKVLNYSAERVCGTEPLYIGMDFNVGRGCAVIHVLRNGNPHAVDEVFNSYDTPDSIRVLKERYPQNSKIVYPDATGKNRKSQNASESDIAQLKTAGFSVKRASSNPSIKDRIASMNGLFCNSRGERRYKVNSDLCPHFADALMQQVYDHNGMPAKGDGKGDDINDAAGYYIHREWPIVKRKAARVI
jgi:hypothetical protein